MAELLLLSAVAAQEFPAVGPFRLVQERREWADAEARCVSIGGQLAKLTRGLRSVSVRATRCQPPAGCTYLRRKAVWLPWRQTIVRTP